MPIVPTPIVSAVVWPSQSWTQRILPAPIQIHQMSTSVCSPLSAHPQQAQTIPIQQTQPTSTPTICTTVVNRPIRIQEVSNATVQQNQGSKAGTQIPSFQRTNKTNSEYPQQRRKSQGVDYNNLILLTKSAMKVRRNQTKAAKKSSVIETAKLRAANADGNTTRWIDKGQQLVRDMGCVTGGILTLILGYLFIT